jgi:general secretion pathway protein L
LNEKKQTPRQLEQSAWVFLGFDLRQIGAFWLQGWSQALSLPWLSWLKPKSEILIHSIGSGVQLYKDNQWLPANGNTQASFYALLLPDEVVLSRLLTVPRLSNEDIKHLLAFEIEGVSPFGGAQTVWGYRIASETDKDMQIELLLTSRTQVNQLLAQLPDANGLAGYELWGLGPSRQPVIFLGFGEARRTRAMRKQFQQRLVLLLLLPFLIVLLFVAPVMEARKTLQQAEQAYQFLQNKVGTLEQKRSLMQSQNQSLEDVIAYAKAQPQSLAVLNLLSEKVPSSAYLTRFSLNAQRVAIAGQADNAAALMQVLGSVPEISNVRAPSAIIRMPGSSQELFALEFNVDLGAKR